MRVLPARLKGSDYIWSRTEKQRICQLISFHANLYENEHISLYISVATLSCMDSADNYLELNGFFFFKFSFYFAILLQEFICQFSVLKHKDLPVKCNYFAQIEVPPWHHDVINTSHPFYPYHFSWVWLQAQINSCLCIMQWNLISI